MTAAASAPRLEVDFDDLPWIVGPTEERPADEWVPQAHSLLLRTLEVDVDASGGQEISAYVRAVLDRVAQASEEDLPYRLLRWLTIDEIPLVASFGLAETSDEEHHLAYLSAVDMGPVEPPVIEEVRAAPGMRARRATSYSEPDHGLFVELRYLVERPPASTDDATRVALLTVGTRDPAALVACTEELDELASRMRIVG